MKVHTDIFISEQFFITYTFLNINYKKYRTINLIVFSPDFLFLNRLMYIKNKHTGWLNFIKIHFFVFECSNLWYVHICGEFFTGIAFHDFLLTSIIAKIKTPQIYFYSNRGFINVHDVSGTSFNWFIWTEMIGPFDCVYL